MTDHEIVAWGSTDPVGVRHEHSGAGGICVCGAQLCCLPECDGWCSHPKGWIEPAELAERNARFRMAQLKTLCLPTPEQDAILRHFFGLEP